MVKDDFLGLGRLAVDGTLRVTNIVEAMHRNIGSVPGTALIYESVRAIARLTGRAIDLAPALPEGASTAEREAMLAALNGVLGDHLAATHNPLAIAMRLRHRGATGGKLVVLLHGLCMNDRQWTRQRHNHGRALARELGYTPVYLHYNSGLHVSTNGREFAGQLEALLAGWPVPVEELAIVGHSMGGLVSRSAWHYGTAAGHTWPGRLNKLVFLGTPHHGAPLERAGNWIDVALGLSRYTAPLASIGKVRSAGITDLRYGNLLDEDWEDRDRFAREGDRRRPVPLPETAQCFAIAAGGDRIVPVESALGRHHDPARSLAFPPSHQMVGDGMNHWDLLNRRAVYEQLLRWLT